MSDNVRRITGYQDLEVYRNTYNAAIRVIKEIIPKLPQSEKYDLSDQMNRACKAVPRLIAEGYAKKHQRRGFQKYLDDAMAECNEMVVCLSQCRDIYGIACEDLIDIYDKSGRQLYNLSMSWTIFKLKTGVRGPRPVSSDGVRNPIRASGPNSELLFSSQNQKGMISYPIVLP